MDYTITNFFIDYFIKSLPVTLFMFLFIIFSASKKTDTFQEILSFLVVTNLMVYAIVNLMNLNDFSEASLTTLTIALSSVIYDKNISSLHIILKSIVSLFAIMIIQIVTIYPFIFVLNAFSDVYIDIPFVINNLLLNTFAQLLASPLQFLVLYKLYLIKKEDLKNG